tara:strand:+ start:488 stop:874 length:387 start_codon:yes stop_codon:yes gene_type:complete
MQRYLNKIFSLFIIFILVIGPIIIKSEKAIGSELSKDQSNFIKKFSKSYTNKFCNSIAFGLSKESAMVFSIEENKKVFNRKKQLESVNKELLAEEIAISVVEKCGLPLNLFGERGIQDFKNFYLSNDN